MTLRELEYIIAVADTLSFSRAADHCHVSQPTLSAQVKKMEAALGITIFERNNRHVYLTDVGREIVKSARQVLMDVAVIKEIARASRDPLSGRFRLGAFPTLASYLFPVILPPIKSDMPQLHLILVEEKTDELLTRLKSGALDAAFIALPVQDAALASQKLFDDPFYLAAPTDHELAEQKSIKAAALIDMPLLLLEEGHCLRDQALDICHVIGTKEQTDYRATSLETLRQMVKVGSGLTLMPQLAIDHDDTSICYIPFESPAPHRTIGLVWRKTTRRMAVIDKILTHIGNQRLQISRA